MRRFLGFLLISACLGQSCAPAEQRGASSAGSSPQSSGRTQATSDAFAPNGEPDSSAPQPTGDVDAALRDACANWDAALGRVAHALADDAANSRPRLDAADVDARLLEEGAPYVWPRAWTLAGAAGLTSELPPRARSFVGDAESTGQRRCGGALVRGRANRVGAALVVVDALADLAPIPSNVRVGSWVEIDAQLLVESSAAKVIVLGPRGRPRPVPTSVNGSNVRARFAADREGPWLVQLLAEVRGGPRPVLEVLVIAGEGPRRALREAAPGENERASNDAAGLLGMLNAARESEQAPSLRPAGELDSLAAAQAEAMHSARRVGHDLGSGDPELRVENAGIGAELVGENAAHGSTLARAHRALWSSPSHRSNMLDERFDSIGIGVAHDSDGSVWVCELFARLAR